MKKKQKSLTLKNPNAAGIDVGSKAHFVAIPNDGRAESSVRRFESFTTDLKALADWLEQTKIETVAMESTSVYWIPLYELLESRGFQVVLVNARHVKNVSGRKTDVLDCQWIQQLHSFGLLAGSFRPEQRVVELRSYMRQRETLLQHAASHIQHIQKALSQMNVQLHNVVSDITGNTGMAIIRDIAKGVRDPVILARHRDARCHNNEDVIAKSLEGNYQRDHVFVLKQSLDLFDFYQSKVRECNFEIEARLKDFDDHHNAPPVEQKRVAKKNSLQFDVQRELARVTGVNLTSIPGISDITAMYLTAECGFDLSRFKSGKHFASWLGLSPNSRVSGGKRLSGRTKPSKNRAAMALRLAAVNLGRSKTALGAFYRRLKSRLGAPKAITATAHKLARLVYAMLTSGAQYVEEGIRSYEERYRHHLVKGLSKRAKAMGFRLVEATTQPFG